MDSKMMAEKLAKMASMMGWSTETIDKLKSEIASKQSPQDESQNQSKWATVIVASVKKEGEDEEESGYKKLCKMDDKSIDDLSDKEAKDLLKSARDEMKKEKGDEMEDKEMDFQTTMNKTGTMF